MTVFSSRARTGSIWHVPFPTPPFLNHVGGVLGVGPYSGCRQEILARWRKNIRAMAECPDVFCKLGVFGMVSFGFDFHVRDVPPPTGQKQKLPHSYQKAGTSGLGFRLRNDTEILSPNSGLSPKLGSRRIYSTSLFGLPIKAFAIYNYCKVRIPSASQARPDTDPNCCIAPEPAIDSIASATSSDLPQTNRRRYRSDIAPTAAGRDGLSLWRGIARVASRCSLPCLSTQSSPPTPRMEGGRPRR